MNGKRRGIIILSVSLLLILLMAVFVGCNSTTQPASPNRGVTKTLRFITGSGASKVKEIVANPGADITPPDDPVKEGSYFFGWYLNSAFTDGPVTIPDKMPEKDTTYYARFTEQGINITLDANGGELETIKVPAAVGRKLTDILKKYVPATEEGIEFDGWYLDDKKVTSSDKAPIKDITLKAMYTAEYKINVYKESLEGEPEFVSEDSKSARVAVGTKVSHTYKKYTGFMRMTDKENASTTFTVGMDPSANVLDIYYDRLVFTVRYLKGEEDAQGDDPEPFELNYGDQLTLQRSTFFYEGHRFAGWKIGDKIFKEGAVVEEEDMTPAKGTETELDIVAVWDRQFDDISGGVDRVYLLGEDSGGRSVELCRDDLPPIRGTVSNNTFTFYMGGTNYQGRLFTDSGKFMWNTPFSGTYYRLIISDEGQLELNKSDTASLSNPTSATVRVDGTTKRGYFYLNNGDGTYVIEATNGEKVHFSLLKWQDGANEVNAYFIRENYSNTYYYAAANGDVLQLVFDGQGGFVVNKCIDESRMLVERQGEGTFTRDGDALRLRADDVPALNGAIAKLSDVDMTVGLKEDAYAKTFDIEGGASLETDGFSYARYQDATGDVEEGRFVATEGGIVFYSSSRSIAFDLEEETLILRDELPIVDFIGEKNTEKFALDGRGMLMYINDRGRLFYESYLSEEFGEEEEIVRFAAAGEQIVLRLQIEARTALKVSAEAGTYHAGSEILMLDGKGNATYIGAEGEKKGTYAKLTQKPYDYRMTASGSELFRFILSEGEFIRRNDAFFGDFEDKFGSETKLWLDGYGQAEVTESSADSEPVPYSVELLENGYINLTASGKDTLKFRLHTDTHKFVKHDPSRELSVHRYDVEYSKDDSAGIDETITLTSDGFDLVTVSGAQTYSGDLVSIENDVMAVDFDGYGRRQIKILSLPNGEGSEQLFSLYDENYDVQLSDEDGELVLNGFGEATYSPLPEGELHGLYSVWGGVIVIRFGDFERATYFNVSLQNSTFGLCRDLVVDGGVVKLYIGNGSEVVEIPSNVGSIDEGAFEGSLVRSIQFATSLTRIEARAFKNCAALSSVTGAAQVQYIGEEAFAGCSSLNELEVLNIREISEGAFKDSPTSVKIGATLTNIGSGAFSHADGVQSELVLPNRLTLGNAALADLAADAFEFTGADKARDLFVIVVSGEDMLQEVYKNAQWREFRDYASLASVNDSELPAKLYEVASLETGVFIKNASFGGKKWAYGPGSRENEYIFCTFDPQNSSNGYVQRLTATYDPAGKRLNVEDGTYLFVESGAALSYTCSEEGGSESKTLTFTMTEGDTLSAQFDGQAVTLDKATKQFSIGYYNYIVTLKTDFTFTYSSEYSPRVLGTYTLADGSDQITLYYLNEERTDFMLVATRLKNDNNVTAGDEYLTNLDGSNAIFAQHTAGERTYIFCVYQYDNRYQVTISIDEAEGTYTATTAEVNKGTRYTLRSSVVEGYIIVYTQGESTTIVQVSLTIKNTATQTYETFNDIKRESDSSSTSGKTYILTMGDSCGEYAGKVFKLQLDSPQVGYATLTYA